MGSDIRAVLRKQILALSDQWCGQPSHARCLSHRLNTEMIAARFVAHDHVEWCCGRSLFIKTAHVETRRVRTPMDELVNRPRIAVEGKDDRFVLREMLNEGGCIHTVRMQLWWVERHEVHDIDQAHLQFWQMLTQPPGGGNCFLGHDVASTGQHNIRLYFVVIARPAPGG